VFTTVAIKPMTTNTNARQHTSSSIRTGWKTYCWEIFQTLVNIFVTVKICCLNTYIVTLSTAWTLPSIVTVTFSSSHTGTMHTGTRTFSCVVQF